MLGYIVSEVKFAVICIAVLNVMNKSLFGLLSRFFFLCFKDYDVFLVWTSLCLSCLGFAQLLGAIGLCPQILVFNQCFFDIQQQFLPPSSGTPRGKY